MGKDYSKGPANLVDLQRCSIIKNLITKDYREYQLILSIITRYYYLRKNDEQKTVYEEVLTSSKWPQEKGRPVLVQGGHSVLPVVTTDMLVVICI